jgi:hypothetical protein
MLLVVIVLLVLLMPFFVVVVIFTIFISNILHVAGAVVAYQYFNV